MISVSNFAHKTAKVAADNSPLILTAIGVAGTISTALLTGRAAFRAAAIIEEDNATTLREYDRRTKVYRTSREVFQLTWQEFIPAGVSLVGTIACIICANRIGTRRAAAMAAAYAISQETLTEYKHKVIEKLGENKERQIRDEIAQDRVRATPPPTEMVISDDLKVICYEQYTGRYFRSSMEEIKAAQNAVNYRIINHNYASLSDFYDLVGLNRTAVSEEVGWNLDAPLEITFSTIMSDDNRPCLSFDYKVVPIRNYFRIR